MNSHSSVHLNCSSAHHFLLSCPKRKAAEQSASRIRYQNYKTISNHYRRLYFKSSLDLSLNVLRPFWLDDKSFFTDLVVNADHNERALNKTRKDQRRTTTTFIS